MYISHVKFYDIILPTHYDAITLKLLRAVLTLNIQQSHKSSSLKLIFRIFLNELHDFCSL